uniref:Uncharacterized protein n=1 Tax=Oryza glumipatula TaxID=40148 RepID=A0A0E0AR11_9ORYZ
MTNQRRAEETGTTLPQATATAGVTGLAAAGSAAASITTTTTTTSPSSFSLLRRRHNSSSSSSRSYNNSKGISLPLTLQTKPNQARWMDVGGSVRCSLAAAATCMLPLLRGREGEEERGERGGGRSLAASAGEKSQPLSFLRRGGWGLPAWGEEEEEEEEEEGAHVARKRGAVVTWWEMGPTKEGGFRRIKDALKARSKVGDQHPRKTGKVALNPTSQDEESSKMPKDNNFSECQPQALKSKTRLHGMRHPNTLGNPLPPPPIPSPSSPLPLPPPPLSSPSSPPIRRSATAADGAAGGCRGEWRQAAAN